jgi:DNA-binding Lrp family transcriptional regulator
VLNLNSELTEQEWRVLFEVQRLPLTSRPFEEIAKRLDLSEKEVIDISSSLLERGAIRRFAVSVSHRKMGFTANPMTVLNVPEERLDEVGKTIAQEPAVTHCYSRSGWDYNLFFMIHGKSREEATEHAEEIARRVGDFPHKIFFSSREFKKTSFEIAKEDLSEPSGAD